MTVEGRPALSRRQQRDATRARLLEIAVEVLIERGVSGTTTLEVQQRASVSRGALLHHFPTHADLLAATVDELVRRNEARVRQEMIAADPKSDPLASAVRALAAVGDHPSYVAELELWAVARCDAALRTSLRDAERRAKKDRDRVIDELFASVQNRPGYAAMVALTVEFIRGMALSGVLRTDPTEREWLLEQWIVSARAMLDAK